MSVKKSIADNKNLKKEKNSKQSGTWSLSETMQKKLTPTNTAIAAECSSICYIRVLRVPVGFCRMPTPHKYHDRTGWSTETVSECGASAGLGLQQQLELTNSCVGA